MAKNKNQNAAQKAKEDEFYTQLCDIERELQHYDMQFRGKISRKPPCLLTPARVSFLG